MLPATSLPVGAGDSQPIFMTSIESHLDHDFIHSNHLHQQHKRQFSETLVDNSLGGEDGQPRRKGRKKSPIWQHTTLDDSGKVHCRHCGVVININYGEKVERLRKHFAKSCPKSPFTKDSKEYEELMEQVSPPRDPKKMSFIAPSSKAKNNRMITFTISFVTSMIQGGVSELSRDQIAQLEAQGNRSSNWSKVQLMTVSSASHMDASLARIRHCFFGGTIFLGVFNKFVSLSSGGSVPAGLVHTNFAGDCVLSDNCYVGHVTLMSNVFVGRNTAVYHCGTVMCDGLTSFGTQTVVTVGSEAAVPDRPQRSFALSVQLSYADIVKRMLLVPWATMLQDASPSSAANNIANNASNNNPNHTGGVTHQPFTQPENSAAAVAAAASAPAIPGVAKRFARSNRSDEFIRYDKLLLCDDIEVAHCPSVLNVFVGSYSRVRHSTLRNVTLLAHCTVSDSEVSDSVCHSATEVSSHARLHRSLMFSHSSVSENARVADSLLGPDSSVAAGEVTRSILGPFVGFHHQGLLLATLWPLGRGNLSAGSLVGANHTTRLNDTECMLGEGCFLGLQASLRFPVNLLAAPYTIIAAQTNLPPQRIEFPFSLLAAYSGGLSGRSWRSDLVQLRPAYVLQENMYMLERMSVKFRARRKSVDDRSDLPWLRPSIVDLVLDAVSRLQRLTEGEAGETCDATLVRRLGGGVCLLTRQDALQATQAYLALLRRYALQGLLYAVVTGDMPFLQAASYGMHASHRLSSALQAGMEPAHGQGEDSDSDDDQSDSHERHAHIALTQSSDSLHAPASLSSSAYAAAGIPVGSGAAEHFLAGTSVPAVIQGLCRDLAKVERGGSATAERDEAVLRLEGRVGGAVTRDGRSNSLSSLGMASSAAAAAAATPSTHYLAGYEQQAAPYMQPQGQLHMHLLSGAAVEHPHMHMPPLVTQQQQQQQQQMYPLPQPLAGPLSPRPASLPSQFALLLGKKESHSKHQQQQQAQAANQPASLAVPPMTVLQPALQPSYVQGQLPQSLASPAAPQQQPQPQPATLPFVAVRSGPVSADHEGVLLTESWERDTLLHQLALLPGLYPDVDWAQLWSQWPRATPAASSAVPSSVSAASASASLLPSLASLLSSRPAFSAPSSTSAAPLLGHSQPSIPVPAQQPAGSGSGSGSGSAGSWRELLRPMFAELSRLEHDVLLNLVVSRMRDRQRSNDVFPMQDGAPAAEVETDSAAVDKDEVVQRVARRCDDLQLLLHRLTLL